ncbi:MAG: PIN domain-containing protein [Bacteroidales bacterium]|jgi:predicted nucleic acid-binding protein|nr:PIN domain-containing protein [Bacteroidales bacterium]
MKRVFLDTNILIDYIDNRTGADNAELIFACGFSGEIKLFASSLTFANMAYIIKGRTKEEKYNALALMADIVEILPLGKIEVMSAIAQPVKDFEDMLQYQCAKTANCDYIVTNDRRHYEFSDITHYSSAEFVAQIDSLTK